MDCGFWFQESLDEIDVLDANSVDVSGNARIAYFVPK